nr:hypothetical protein [Erwinia sp. Ejp617]
MSCAPALWAGAWPPSLAALASSSSSANGNKAGRLVGLRSKQFMPARLRLSVTARSRSSLLVPAPSSFRCPPLPVLSCKTRRSLNLPRLTCGLRQPAPGRRPSTAQRAAPRPPALIMTVLTWRCSSGKRWYDAAVQAQRPRPGGSVRGQKRRVGASGLRGG